MFDLFILITKFIASADSAGYLFDIPEVRPGYNQEGKKQKQNNYLYETFYGTIVLEVGVLIWNYYSIS